MKQARELMLTSAQVERMVGRMKDRLLESR